MMNRMTDFATLLSSFLTEYLPVQKGASIQTISSYRDTFKLLLRYLRDEKKVQPEKVKFALLDREVITAFLKWLESERGCGVSTRNQRLAAIRSFIRYAQFEFPEKLDSFQRILSIPSKKTQAAIIPYLTADEMRLILAEPDRSTVLGRRDLAILSMLYDSGCRVQELIDLRICDLVLEPAGIATLHGKGGKTRRVPIEKNTVQILRQYIADQKLDINNDELLFAGRYGNKLTREGVTYIISKYVSRARAAMPSIPEKVTPHIFRHTRAMLLLQAGVNLIYIRDFLGHTDIKTTEIYAKADTELKRKAIESTIGVVFTESGKKDWTQNGSLMEWLNELC